MGDPAGRGAVAEGSERLSRERRTRAGGDGSELRVFAGRRRSARAPRRGTRSRPGSTMGTSIQMIGLACWKREDVAPHFGFLGDCSPLPTSGNHAPVIVLASESDMLAFHPTVLGFGKSAFFTRNPANPNWRQYRDGGDLTSARTNPVARSPEPEHRRRQAHLPRRVRQLDQVDTRQRPRASLPPLATSKGAWTRRMPSSRRRMPMAISREGFDSLTSNRRSTGALPALHSAVTRRSILPGSTRSIRSCSSVAPSPGSAMTSCSAATLRAGST